MKRSSRTIWTTTVLAGMVWLCTGCGSDFMAKSVDNRNLATLPVVPTIANDDGAVVGRLSSQSNETQRLKAETGGSIKGSTLVLPPGALSVDVNVTIEEGSSLVTSTAESSLDLGDGALSAAGPAVVFNPSDTVEASVPFTLAIPIDQELSLLGNTGSIAILYKVLKLGATGTEYVLGIKPPSEITIENGTAKFETTRFGVFQVVRSKVEIKEEKSVQTFEPITAKKKASNPLVGRWISNCDEDTRHDHDGAEYTEIRRSEVTFADEAFSYLETVYESAGCTGGVRRQHGFVGKYKIGEASVHVAGAKDIDISFESSVMTFATKNEVEHANSSRFCGITNWEVGEAREIGGLDCGEDDKEQPGDVMYQIFKVENDTLRFGNDHNEDGKDEVDTRYERPQELEDEKYAMKRAG